MRYHCSSRKPQFGLTSPGIRKISHAQSRPLLNAPGFHTSWIQKNRVVYSPAKSTNQAKIAKGQILICLWAHPSQILTRQLCRTLRRGMATCRRCSRGDGVRNRCCAIIDLQLFLQHKKHHLDHKHQTQPKQHHTNTIATTPGGKHHNTTQTPPRPHTKKDHNQNTIRKNATVLPTLHHKNTRTTRTRTTTKQIRMT